MRAQVFLLRQLIGVLGLPCKVEDIVTFIPTMDRLLTKAMKLSILDAAFSRGISNFKLDSWQVRLHSDLKACAALQMSLIDRC